MIEAFFNDWLWTIFIIVGLAMIMLELIIGVETGLDMAILGTVLLIAGLVTLPFSSWLITVIVAIVICALYLFIGRKYVRRWRWKGEIKTNIDAIIGKSGLVRKRIARNADGIVKVGNEEWRARADEDIEVDEEIVVTDITGATLIVKKKEVS